MYLFFETDIWRNLNLFLDISDSWGATAKYPGYLDGRHADLLRYVSAMVRMMEDVRSEGKRHRYGLIDSIKVAPFPNFADTLLQLLVDVSQNLERLAIVDVSLSNVANTAESFETRLHHKYLYYRAHFLSIDGFINRNIPTWRTLKETPPLGPPFLALAFLQLGECTTFHPETITLLLTLAPNLQRIALKIVADHQPVRHSYDPDEPRLPCSLDTDTKLLALCVEYCHAYGESEKYVLGTIKDIIQFSPRLQQLSLHLGVFCEEYEFPSDELVPYIQDMKQLVDLAWLDPAGDSPLAGLTLNDSGFGSLKRAVLEHYADELPDRSLPSSSTLEVLHLTRGYRRSWQRSRQSASTGVLPIDTFFAEWLRDCPRVRVVNYLCHVDDTDDSTLFDRLDHAEARGDVTAPIHSMRHRDAEVLYAQIQIQTLEYAELQPVADGWPRYTGGIIRESVLHYTGEGHSGQLHSGPKSQLCPPEWQDYSDFDGATVPMRVIKEMREVEGLGEDGWKARGVEVGAAAWGVLEAWRAAGSPAE